MPFEGRLISHLGKLTERSYTETVTESVKVPADKFKAVVRALLTTAPITAKSIVTPRSRKPRKRAKARR